MLLPHLQRLALRGNQPQNEVAEVVRNRQDADAILHDPLLTWALRSCGELELLHQLASTKPAIVAGALMHYRKPQLTRRINDVLAVWMSIEAAAEEATGFAVTAALRALWPEANSVLAWLYHHLPDMRLRLVEPAHQLIDEIELQWYNPEALPALIEHGDQLLGTHLAPFDRQRERRRQARLRGEKILAQPAVAH